MTVRGIRIQGQYNDLVIGTHGRGAWILDDIQPLVELAQAVENDVHLFEMRTQTDWEMWGRGSSRGQSLFMGQNPQQGAWIQYYLSVDAASQLGDRGATVRITDAAGTLVRELQDRNAGPGINRAVWDFTWTGADPIPGEPQGGGGGFFRRFGGGQGPPAVPGMYMATIVAGGEEHSTPFRLRGDPNVTASQADYQERFTAAMRARDLQSQLNAMVGTIVDLNGQIDGLLESIDGKDLANESEIQSTAGEAQVKLTTLEAEVRRPAGSMGYRDWPRLIEQLRTVARQIQGPQARPTEGQMQVLTEVEAAAAQRAQELSLIVDGVIADLNRLLQDAPKILTDWRRVVM